MQNNIYIHCCMVCAKRQQNVHCGQSTLVTGMVQSALYFHKTRAIRMRTNIFATKNADATIEQSNNNNDNENNVIKKM